MITDFNLRHKHRRVQDKLDELNLKRRQAQEGLRALGLTENQKRSPKKPEGVDERTWLARERFIQHLSEIEEEQKKLHKERKRLADAKEAGKNLELSKIFKELFTDEQRGIIGMEAESRAEGNEPKPIPFSLIKFNEYKDLYYQYRPLAKDQLDKMIQFRIELTGLIEKGCEQFGKAEFLKFISPLNKLIMPVEDLKKIKLKHHL